jgi:hypothetical protein
MIMVHYISMHTVRRAYRQQDTKSHSACRVHTRCDLEVYFLHTVLMAAAKIAAKNHAKRRRIPPPDVSSKPEN